MPRCGWRIDEPRHSARPKKSKQKARAGHPKRDTHAQLRYAPVELLAPKHHAGKPPLKLWMLHVHEEHPPASVAALEWFLLSTRAISSPEQAEQCLR